MCGVKHARADDVLNLVYYRASAVVHDIYACKTKVESITNAERKLSFTLGKYMLCDIAAERKVTSEIAVCRAENGSYRLFSENVYAQVAPRSIGDALYDKIVRQNFLCSIEVFTLIMYKENVLAAMSRAGF